MDDFNVLVRGGDLSEVMQTLTQSLGQVTHEKVGPTFEVEGQTIVVYDGADYEDDAVGPLSTYPITIAVATGTNREMEARALRVQQILHKFDTLALRNLSTRLPTSDSAAA